MTLSRYRQLVWQTGAPARSRASSTNRTLGRSPGCNLGRAICGGLLLAASISFAGCSSIGGLKSGEPRLDATETVESTKRNWFGKRSRKIVKDASSYQPLANQIAIARRASAEQTKTSQTGVGQADARFARQKSEHVEQVAWSKYGEDSTTTKSASYQVAESDTAGFRPARSERHPAAEPSFDFPRSGKLQLATYNANDMEILAPGKFRESYQDAHEAPGELPLERDHQSMVRMQTDSVPAYMANATPIDLANALGIAGANNLDIKFARERLVAAHANYDLARVAWLPTLRLGVGFTKHDGQIQSTEGDVIDSDRNALFLGGGAGLGEAPLAGGSGGPLRLVTNLSVADTIFNRRIARQRMGASDQDRKAVTNQTLLEVSLAYFDLVEAYGMLANAENSREAAQKLLDLTEDFAEEGAGNRADVDRARTEQLRIRQQMVEVRRLVLARSERLKRLLRYQTPDALAPVDLVVLPLEIYPQGSNVDQLVAEGMMTRNEIQREEFEIAANCQELRRETLRPLLPSVHVGASGGMFGGGQSTQLDNIGARSDLDVIAVWEAENIGLGNRFRKRETASRVRQSQQQASIVRDQIREEITVAAANVDNYREQLALASEAMMSAQQSYERNFDRIQEGEGLPIELLQAIRAQYESLNAYTSAVTLFNRAQFQLIRAVGHTPAG